MTNSVWVKVITVKVQFKIMIETCVLSSIEKNIKLNPERLQLIKQEALYIGHLLTPDDLTPDPNKAKAILEMSILV